MLIGSINYNNNLGFLLVFLLGSMVLVSIIYTWRNLLGLNILSVTASPVFAGETAVFDVVTRSDTLQRNSIGFAFKKEAHCFETVFAKNPTTVKVTAKTKRRGLHLPGKLTIFTRFPIGLFRAWSKLNIDTSVVVYPKPTPGPLHLADGVGTNSEKKEIQTAGVDDFKGLRQYRPGDAVQHIAWKSLGRCQGLFTKQFANEISRSVIVDYTMVRADDKEKKISRLTDMVIQADRMKIAYGLKLPGKYLPPDKGHRHRHNCLKTLALSDAKD
jgi:uncharacterized protein (DUF58 family)